MGDDTEKELKKTTIRVESDVWEEMMDITENRSEALRKLMRGYVETADMDRSVVETRESIMRAHLSTLQKEKMMIEDRIETVKHFLDDEEDSEHKDRSFKVDLGRL